jgi:hypothetical protein
VEKLFCYPRNDAQMTNSRRDSRPRLPRRASLKPALSEAEGEPVFDSIATDIDGFSQQALAMISTLAMHSAELPPC